MADDIEIDAQGEHGYLVTQPSELEDVRTWFKVTPEVMDQLGADDEEDVVLRTVQFLRRHQDVADFPEAVDLEDVIASYDEYLTVMTAD
ncbi:MULTISPECIES: hypothetical protein [unclassified Modestobacter]|uniref:hypothetical protein n=1 Tax=unclassified Modestobacter TaxID=2643866 RepID=UPI0022AAC1EB|nr:MULTISPECIES: hypothetical protein [unclassified Modestobacter]MCZ2811096.1 hypothetical protein [Modestobacter sp. VKM Ac-2979]MCZ2821593.1 hypothetical protein [Modestobacter sp. VKM Ac-2977]MCZ2840609.1 hypothetical protein [Modestobacter sp. VKM Ac-2980]MCZ2847896.1 hypothetical protein [Modestobacter sp. VKM Ac-2978]